jgi:hypothetical protein
MRLRPSPVRPKGDRKGIIVIELEKWFASFYVVPIRRIN